MNPRAIQAGFHLIELLIALMIFAVLFALALPSYQAYDLRAKRSDAVQQMMQVVLCQEAWRGANGSYDTTKCTKDLGNSAYRIEITPPDTAPTSVYTVSATPRVQVTGDDCGVLSIDQAGTRSASGRDASASDCWGGR